MYPAFIPALIARCGVTITLLLIALASTLALSGCEASANGTGSERDEDGNGNESPSAELSRQTSTDSGAAPQPQPIDPTVRYQWVGQIALSEVHGIQLGTECGSWLLTFDSPEIEAEAANSAGLDVIVWGNVTGLDDPDIVQSVPGQSIKVESVFGSDDPKPDVYVPEYPCGGTVPPDYPVIGIPEIDLLPGEIAAVGKFVKSDDGGVYLDTDSGRILLRFPEVLPPVACDDSGQESRDLPLAPEVGPAQVDCLEPTVPEDLPLGDGTEPSEILPEPDSVGSGGGVDGSVGTAEPCGRLWGGPAPSTGEPAPMEPCGTLSGGPAPSTVDPASADVGDGESIVVGTWSMEDGRLVIDVRYILDRSYVYPRPVITPGPLPTPTPIGPEDAGYIAGQVAIGPLCPVEPCTAPAPGEVYSKHVLMLESEDGAQIEVPLYDGGYFRAELKPGTYVVTLSDCEYMGCDAALPVKVEVAPGTIEELVIDIDTGIR